ncbi:MAG: hypothetical protein ACYSTY_04050, partial [Planctomycetota bacterium]
RARQFRRGFGSGSFVVNGGHVRGGGVSARPPIGQEDEQVSHARRPVAVHVAAGAAPCAEERQQVGYALPG